jgi:ribonuclease E
MSRQRIRTGVLESSSIPCPHCAGTGFVRSTPSVALHVLRSIEETLIKNAGYNLIVRTRTEAAFYILNQKRIHLRDLETRFGVAVSIMADDTLTGATNYAIDRGEPALRLEHKSAATGIQIDAIVPVDEPIEDEADLEVEAEEPVAEEAGAERGEEGEGNGRRRRRRRRRRGRDREVSAGGAEGDGSSESEEEGDDREDGAESEGSEAETVEASDSGEADGEGRNGRRRRRGRRGGRGRGRDEAAEEFAAEEGFAPPVDGAPVEAETVTASDGAALAEPPMPAPAEERIVSPAAPEPVAEAAPAAPEPAVPEPEPVAVVLTPPDPERPKRAGWWSKAKSVLSGS